jgi:hypothetical protein
MRVQIERLKMLVKMKEEKAEKKKKQNKFDKK